MLTKRINGVTSGPRLKQALAGVVGGSMDRRTFLKRSGIAAAGVTAVSLLPIGMVKAQSAKGAAKQMQIAKSVCTHCSVGCTVIAELENGVWVGQEPGWDSPFSLGAHCAKGAAVREHSHNERRLRYPMKLAGGKWQRLSWDQAINEIGDKVLDVQKKSGPDSVYWMGSAKFSNEQAYLFRKFAAFAGTNNVDHQARICHSTTVAGVANTFGYGAMTNSYNDMLNSRAMIFLGSNAAEAHPVAMQHILKAKEQNNSQLIICDPRFTRTAAHANEYVRFRPGTDVALVWGLLWHIFENGWEDKNYIRSRVYGMDKVRDEVKKWAPDEVEKVTGVPGAQVKRVARTLANNRPGTLVWCMGGTQHHHGNNNTRAYTILQMALGNVGTSGGGCNIFRGHDNVQGATDLGIEPWTLPGYYGVAKGAWMHWSRVWDVSYDYLKSRFKDEKLMHATGIALSRWIDGVLEDKKNIDQPDNIRVLFYWGHAPNSQVRLPEMKKAMEKLDMMVVIDPVPTFSSVIPDRKDGVYVLPAANQYETSGSVTASNRSLQWRERITKPLYEAKPDHEIMYLFAKKLGFEKEMFKKIKVNGTEPSPEDILREINRGVWTIGYTGQSPERLKMHMANQHTFDRRTLRASGGPANGEYYGLPWPCWGTPETKHTGTPNLYDTSKPVAEGGLNFRANWGVAKDGVNLLAEGSYPVGAEIKDGHPPVTYGLLKKLGWDKDLTPAEKATIEKIGGDKPDGVSFAIDLSGGLQRVALKHGVAPFGNGKARAFVWNFPDPVPLHREPLYAPDRALVAKYPTWTDRKLWRLPTKYESIQKQDFSKQFPTILTMGRLVEYEGGGDESRANKWLAELQQHMFCEVNPIDANNVGIRDGQDMWVHSPNGGKAKVKALVTERVGKGVVFMPFHFGGHWMGQSLRAKYPPGADPYVLGEASNMCGTYGYDIVTQMQETKTTLCRIERA
jgi:formate dehydrogenase major subunit